MPKRILVALNHPAQYHFLKNIIKNMSSKHILIVIREKDILKRLLDLDGLEYEIVGIKPFNGASKKGLIFHKIKELIVQDIKLNKIVKEFKPNLMLGTDIAITHVGAIRRIPSIVLNEDDIEINKLFCYFSYPFASVILTPKVCNVGRFYKKRVGYEGYQKLTYLSPTYFKPNLDLIKNNIDTKIPFFIIRLVNFKAGHDLEKNHSGLSVIHLRQLIETLSLKGKVFITSEAKVDEEFKQYQLIINPLHIHHYMYFCSLFISDSQSMTMEAAMLGTPSIRFNSFVGKISVLNQLEKEYSLTFGIHCSNSISLINKVKEILSSSDFINDSRENRNQMLADKIDVTAFMVWFIENYPQSAKIMKENPNYQDRFK